MIQKFKNFFIANQLEIFSILGLYLIFILLLSVFINHFGHIVLDSGREAFFPLEVLRGKILYKDLFNIFGPFSYQINALFYKLLGINLKSLNIAGTICASMILFVIYFISRQFLSKKISWAITCFIMVSCAIHPWIFNYIFPYAFSMTYAFCGFLFSVLFLILYLKTSKQCFLPLSWFFLGVSIASKYEYLLYFVLLFFLTIITKPAKKYLLYSFFSFLIVPFVCFFILFHQGLTLNELINQFHLIKNYATSPALNSFYRDSSGLFPVKEKLIDAIKTFIQVFSLAGFLITSIYSFFNWQKNKTASIYKRLLIFGFMLTFCYLFFSYTKNLPWHLFCWLPIFCTFLFVVLLFINKKSFIDSLHTKEIIFLLFVLISLFASVKSFFFLSLSSYGTYAFPLLLIVFLVFILEYLPLYFKSIDKEIFQSSLFVFLLSLTVFFIVRHYFFIQDDFPLKTPRGTIYNSRIFVNPYKKTIEYINKKMKKDDSILVMPEGIMLNFLTDHPTKEPFYATYPAYIETFGEENIKQEIKKNPPDYIIINNRDSNEYGACYFCKDYAHSLCSYIKSNYIPVASFGSDFVMKIYKKITRL